MNDQANKLRKMVKDQFEPESFYDSQIKVYSVVSGKGGVGKTNLTVNLGIGLQQMGKRVLLLDADVGMSNTHLVMGVDVEYSILDLIKKDLELKDIIARGPNGVDLISGGEDLFLLEELDKERQEKILGDLEELGEYDILLIDNGAGITKHTLTFTLLADEIILVTTPEPTALTDAYRVLKAISVYELGKKVKVVINQVTNDELGLEAFNKLLKTSGQFLKIDLENLGYIYNDVRVSKSIMAQSPIIEKYPEALASENINQIGLALLGDKNYKKDISNLKQFKNRLIRLFG